MIKIKPGMLFRLLGSDTYIRIKTVDYDYFKKLGLRSACPAVSGHLYNKKNKLSRKDHFYEYLSQRRWKYVPEKKK